LWPVRRHRAVEQNRRDLFDRRPDLSVGASNRHAQAGALSWLSELVLDRGRTRKERVMTPVQQAKAYLEHRIEVTAASLLPGGKKDGSEWRGMRKSRGGPGDSVSIHVAKDDKIGMCSFFASGEPGTRDIVTTWMRLRGIADKDWKRFFDDMAAFAGTDFGY